MCPTRQSGTARTGWLKSSNSDRNSTLSARARDLTSSQLEFSAAESLMPWRKDATIAFAELVRWILEHERKAGANHLPRKNDWEEILLDVEVDGARYVLVCLPKSTHGSVSLSPREREIALLIAEGQPNKLIAQILNISPWTVSTYLRRIFAKLGVGSRAAMIARLPEIESWRNQLSPARTTLEISRASHLPPQPSSGPSSAGRKSHARAEHAS